MPRESPANGGAPSAITSELLRGWPLPRADDGADVGRGKESRGSVLVAGGSIEVPGAIVLAGMATLRAGAGKLRIATCRDVAPAVAVAVPEARVIGLPRSESGDIDPSGAARLASVVGRVAAALIGPGMLDIATVQELMRRLLPHARGTALVLDAGALSCISDRKEALHHLDDAVVLTPHSGELALMLGREEDDVTRDPLGSARDAAAELRAIVALKGARTYVAAPDGTVYCYADGPIGLATSGSGDTLAGVIAGLLARGAEPAQAAVWGVYLHGGAGRVMTARVGKVGFLAREVLAEVPALLAQFDED
jgi:ADP-dependent NAD(P)H-hydrate dehydratase